MTRLYPAISRHRLYIIAALLWAGVGFMLISRGIAWLSPFYVLKAWLLTLAGIILGVIGHLGPFSTLAQKNIARIRSKPLKSCIFGFQAIKSYLLLLLMLLLGLTLRHSRIDPQYLAVVYLAVGTALALSSLLYYPLIFGNDNERA